MTRVIAVNKNNREVNVNWVKKDEIIKLEIDNQPKDLIIYYHKDIAGNKLIARYNGRIIGTSDYYNFGHFKSQLLKELFNIKLKIVNS